MITALFLGYSGSGKTTSIVHLTRLLSSRGMRVCVLKHIGAGHTLIDPSKDTGRFLVGGAVGVGALEEGALTLFYRGMGVEEGYGMLAALSPDYLFVEGFSRDPLFLRGDTRCVVCAKTEVDAAELIRLHSQRRIVCATGVFAQSYGGEEVLGVPVVRLPGEADRLVGMLSE